MDLPVVVDGNDPYVCLGLTVPGEQHRTRLDPFRSAGVGQGRPAETVVVLCVQVGYEVEIVIVHVVTVLVVSPHDTG